MNVLTLDSKTKVVRLNDKKIKLTIWDTAGQERFRTLTSSYYRGCQGVLVVFDLSNRASFDQIPKWFEELHLNISPGVDNHSTTTTVVTHLVGNKVDRGRVVSREEAESMRLRVGATAYLEVSAKQGDGVQELFENLTRDVMAMQATLPDDSHDHRAVHLTQDADASTSNCAC